MAAQAVPVPQQYNWIHDSFDAPLGAEQLKLDLGDPDEWLDEDPASLIVTANGSQLYVAGYGVFLGKRSERVTVKHKGRVCGEVLLAKLQEIVVASRGVTVSGDVIENCCERGIRLSFLSGSGRPFALLTSPMLTATVETRRAQFAAIDSPTGAAIAQYIVAGKLRNQEKLLRYFARRRESSQSSALLRASGQLRELRRKALARSGTTAIEARATLMGLEGVGGRIYWEQWVNLLPPTLEFGGRCHAGAGDAVNASLNYGYGILTGHVWGAIMNAGLEPFAGFLHVDRSGKPSLALDLVEEFRQPVVDRAVFSWLTKGGRPVLDKGGLLEPSSKEEVAVRVMQRLNATEVHRGKQHQVRSIIQMQARLCASAVKGMRPYRPFAFQW